MSTESIASPTKAQPAAAAHCSACGAALAPDQRYCLHCGERCVPMSSVMTAGSSAAGAGGADGSSPPQHPPGMEPGRTQGPRNPALTVIAGVGVLLLAMGVGVLIGRSSVSRSSPAPAQVIDLAGAGAGSQSAAGGEAAFTSDWPAGTKGYTVELQTLAQSTTVSAVEAAKTAATAKGAGSVGALKGEEFSSLGAVGYVIYSGVYHTRAEAAKALAPLERSFSSAKVVEVSNGTSAGSSPAGGSGSSSSSSGGAGSNLAKPAPPSVLQTPKKATGKSFEETSKNLPDVVETG